MTIGPRWISSTVLAAVLALTPIASAQAPAARADAAATIGDETIPLAELERLAATELAGLEEQRYRVLERKLSELIAQRLIAREAQRRGVSVDALIHAEVTAKTPPVTGQDVDVFISENRSRLPRGNDVELRSRVADYLHRLQVNQRTEAFVASLRTRTPVQVHLAPPEPARVSIDATVGFARGPSTAAVSIVEFSDFHCPFCRNVVATLEQLLALYPDRVRWVFRDFPIASLHPEAPRAHEAARCAGEQGKFWPYHDRLFAHPPDVAPAALRAHARETGLDAAAFDRCLDGGKHRAAVAADVELGTRLGVTGTPTFFINGSRLVGNQPLADFQRIIERELARTAATR